MVKFIVPAEIEQLDKVLSFIDGMLDKSECSVKSKLQIDVAVEEIFVNIASYAYGNQKGNAEIEYQLNDNSAVITFTDSGEKYNPLERDEPDVTLSADEREIGGLGILMVRKSMDDIKYSYENGKNILTIYKSI